MERGALKRAMIFWMSELPGVQLLVEELRGSHSAVERRLPAFMQEFIPLIGVGIVGVF